MDLQPEFQFAAPSHQAQNSERMFEIELAGGKVGDEERLPTSRGDGAQILLADMGAVHMGVDLGGGDVRMPQDLLDDAQIGAPASMWVAKEWRSVWGVMSLLIPAFSP